MLETGLTYSTSVLVDETNTAATVGSGELPVFATPMLLALAEACCCGCLKGQLEAGMTSVGTQVNLSHTAATPVGMTVTCTCELTEIDGRRLVFRVTMSDEAGEVGHGTHERFLVGKERFIPLYRVAVKALTEYLDKSRKLLILSSDETALFVNAARSAIVDYAALERVLNEEAIGGAIIDVLDTEPPTEADLSIGRCPNVLLTPHICGATYEVTDHQSRILNERIKKWLRNEDLEKVVYNRDVLKG